LTTGEIAAHFQEVYGAEISKDPAISKLWEIAWSEFIPFLDYDVEIRRVICSTNAIESINASYRRAVRARGHFPNDTAALKCLYLVTRALDPTGRGRARWAMRWKPALDAFAIALKEESTNPTKPDPPLIGHSPTRATHTPRIQPCTHSPFHADFVKPCNLILLRALLADAAVRYT
jgi:hypothetical protein